MGPLQAQTVPVASYVPGPAVRLGSVETSYTPYVPVAEADGAAVDVDAALAPGPGVVEVPVFGRAPGDARGLVLTVDYDQIFLTFQSFREAGRTWRAESEAHIVSDADGDRLTLRLQRYSDGSDTGDNEFLIGHIQFSLDYLDPADRPAFDHELPLRLARPEKKAETHYYTSRADGRELELTTELIDGKVVVYFADGAELGSGLVSPLAQDVTVPLYLTVLAPSGEPLDLTVDYDQIFLNFVRAVPTPDAPFTAGAPEDASTGEGGVTVRLQWMDPDSASTLLRRHVADLVFAYSGAVPDDGYMNLSVHLLGSDKNPKEPRENGGVREDVRARIEVGSPYFVRGNVTARYERLADGGVQYGGVAFSDGALILRFLTAGAALPCEAAADADANGHVNITDAVLILRYLFSSGSPPQAPFPRPDFLADYETDLDCESSLPFFQVDVGSRPLAAE